MASPIPLRSLRSFAFEEVIFLLDIYLAIKLSESLMFLESETKYLIDP